MSPLLWVDQDAGGDRVHITVDIGRSRRGEALRAAGTLQELAAVLDLDPDSGLDGHLVEDRWEGCPRRLASLLAWVARESREVIARTFAAIDDGVAEAG